MTAVLDKSGRSGYFNRLQTQLDDSIVFMVVCTGAWRFGYHMVALQRTCARI